MPQPSRDEMILAYLPVCRKIALVAARGCTSNEAYDIYDATSDATVGLIKAADQWKPDLGPFYPYACRRMLGAVLDGLRDWDYMTRGQRRGHQKADLPDPQIRFACMDLFPAPNGHDPIREALGEATWDFARKYLKPAYFEVLDLMLRQDIRQHEIAVRNRVTDSAIKFRYDRALRSLRRKLGVDL